MFQQNLLDYAQAADPHFDNGRILMYFSYSITTISVVLEMICYLVFFAAIFKYTNGASILPAETKKSRNRANAQSMMGQIYFFMLDIIFLVLNAIALGFGDQTRSSLPKDIGATYKMLEIVIISVTHCFLIQEIRNRIMLKILKIKNSVSNAFNRILRCSFPEWVMCYLINNFSY